MAQTPAKHPLPGLNELSEVMHRWTMQVLPNVPAALRLEGLTPEERLQGLTPEERAQLKARLERETDT